jgi:hypothetical protein
MQSDAVASQKLTWPVLTTEPPAVTEALKLTTAPEATLVTALPPEVTVRLIALAEGICAQSFDGAQAKEIDSSRSRSRMQGRDVERALKNFAWRPEEHERNIVVD